MAQTKTVGQCLFLMVGFRLCPGTVGAGDQTLCYSRILGDSAIGFGFRSVGDSCTIDQQVLSGGGSCSVRGSFGWTDPISGQRHRLRFGTQQNGRLRVLPQYRVGVLPAPPLAGVPLPTSGDPCVTCQTENRDCFRCNIGQNAAGVFGIQIGPGTGPDRMYIPRGGP